MKHSWLGLAFALASLPSFTQNMAVGEPSYSGTGCPDNSAFVVLGADAKSLSILFDQYVAQAAGADSEDRKTCNISIPIHVPEGMSVSIRRVDYQGLNNLPYGASARLNADYFFAGTKGSSYQKTFMGDLAEPYKLTRPLNVSFRTWSSCGQDINLITNSVLSIKSNRQGEQSLSRVGTTDAREGITYYFESRGC